MPAITLLDSDGITTRSGGEDSEPQMANANRQDDTEHINDGEHRVDRPPRTGFVFPSSAPALPLTPPSPLLESKQQSPSTVIVDSSQLQSANVTANTTPSRQTNILTPENTPPRTVLHGLKRPVQQRNFPSMSSRAESFKTAREVFSSDDEALYSPDPASTPRQPRLLRPYNTPNDFGQHTVSSSPQSTPKARKEKVPAECGQPSPSDKRLRASGTGSINVQKTRAKRETSSRNETTGPGFNGERSLRERIKEPRQTVNNSAIEKFGRDMGWPSDEDRDRHSCRLSGVSANSTIEAYIIDSPPRKKPTLRHVEKAESLRSITSNIPHSYRDTSVSGASDQRGRLVRKSARITNRDRWSIASDTLSLVSTTTYSKPPPPREVIPVVIVPQRRSSLYSLTSCNRDHSQTRSVTENRRPTTAPNGGSAMKPYDLPKRRRTVSEALPYTRKSSDTARSSITSRPRIPTRRSSLSAPTSRNPSRTASLTSDNLHRYQAAQEAEYVRSQKLQEALQGSIKPAGSFTVKTERPVSNNLTARESSHNRFSADAHCNDSLLQPPSLPKTPFQSSIQSLSPGPIEISEARVVPFFAHNNKSLLVVEQYPQAESRAVQRLRTSVTDMELTLAEPRTPVLNSQTKPSLDSPLRNPRPPPKPPVLKVTPPMPYEANHKLPSSSTESSNGLVRRWESLRRSFNSRRVPGVNQPETVHKIQNRKAGKNIDSELHPFWRPRGFWEDFGEWDISGEHIQRRPTPPMNSSGPSDTYIGNSLGIPQKRIFQGPLTLFRRVSNRHKFRAPRRQNASHTSIISATLSLSGQRGGSGNHMLSHFLSFREMQAWIARTRRRRQRERLEAKRNKLRHMIGERVTVDPNSVVARHHFPPTASAFDS